MKSLSINYKSSKSILCDIGKKYDTDKSSQRSNVTNVRHCHPYTLFYDSLFNMKRKERYNIAEIGILDGASLLMWKEYFINSTIYGFEYNNELIKKFNNKNKNKDIIISHINVTSQQSITNAFSNNIKYDIIIDDSTHQFEDQIRIISNVYQYLKPGGILIIEDIFKSYNEKTYINRLGGILEHFQDYYFVSLDHVNRNSTGWDNDKLFVLIKNGAEPIFKKNNKMTIITPSYRIDNLITLKNSINFDYINEWIIVYDGSKIKEIPNNINHNMIKQYIYEGDGCSGNQQRNYALTKIKNKNTFLYYLDDDNIIHPNLYKLLDIISYGYMYTFNQLYKSNHLRLKGNDIKPDNIDTAMMLIDYNLCKDIKWIHDKYNADGYYITECYMRNTNNHIYIDNEICYYNYLIN